MIIFFISLQLVSFVFLPSDSDGSMYIKHADHTDSDDPPPISMGLWANQPYTIPSVVLKHRRYKGQGD